MGNYSVFVGKVFILIVGAGTLGLGIYSHYESQWIKSVNTDTPLKGRIYEYEACDLADNSEVDLPCPPIVFEIAFVGVILACFVTSLVDFLVGLCVDMRLVPFRLLDLLYHILAALLLAGAANLYIVSAVQIKDLYESTGETEESLEKMGIKYLTTEKFIATGLGLLQALLSAIVAIFIATQ